MYTTVLDQRKEIVDITSLPVAVERQPEGEIDRLLKELSPDTAWGDRQIAAQKLGSLGDPSALPGLLAALPNDPFWMVRTAMIQVRVVEDSTDTRHLLCQAFSAPCGLFGFVLGSRIIR